MKGKIEPVERRAFSIRETERATNLSRATLYRLVASGKLKTVKVGGRRLVLVTSIDALLHGGA